VTLRSAAARFIRPRPLEWERGAGRGRAEPPASVDVIVPVYGAAADLQACLASVERHTDLMRHRVVLTLDGPQPAEVMDVVAAFAKRQHAAARLLEHEERLGFAGNVNRALRATASDVVLLNSDTLVTARWLEKLCDAAYSDGDVGTVTPLSNHATLCSVPRGFVENALPSGMGVEEFGALIENVSESVSERCYVKIPTGVGFCLYVRRAVLDDVGLLDEQRFGLGYGEEVDFCLRALQRGWVHLADDATFVYHAGSRSFGGESERRKRLGAKALANAHRRYLATIAVFMRRDPLARVRRRIGDALTKAPDEELLRIVHLVHGWPPAQQGGTELYASWLAAEQRTRHHVAIYTRLADPARNEGEVVEQVADGMRVRAVTKNFTARDPVRRNGLADAEAERDFERFLQDERPDLLHVHHLAGHAFSLPGVAKRLGIPVVMQIQDWWFRCARVNQLHRDGYRCSGPSPTKCAACVQLTKVPPAAVSNRLLHVLRRRAARAALRTADVLLAGSEAIRRDYASDVPRETPFHVLPYGVPIEPRMEPRAPATRPLRFGCVGAIAPHKGVHVATEAFRAFRDDEAELHLWGDPAAFPEYVASLHRAPNVIFEGRFEEHEKAQVFDSLDVLLVPSIGLESFGLAAREAMARGVPVIVTTGGAFDELGGGGAYGEYVAPGDVDGLRAVLARLVADPSIVDRWREHLPRPKSAAAHAAEIEAVYRDVLERSRR
jgi:glycosyltransferase involved in cell wall biosynthesis/GT2 family glycosyltransferase